MKKNILYRIFSYPFTFTKKSFKILKLRIKHKLGLLGKPEIIAYRGFTNGSDIFISGLITEDKGLQKPEQYRTKWQNAIAMIKRYSGDEFPEVGLKVILDNKILKSKTDANGFFKVERSFNIDTQGPVKQWLPYECSTLIVDDEKEYRLIASGEILSPVASTKFGVISDIDDTIIVSHSTRILRKLYLMLSRNSRTRKPFSGAAAFYRALNEGVNGDERNPFFYVSSSEWNLYDLLDDFCSYNGFPKGVFMLKELISNIWEFGKSGGGTHEQKYHNIRRIFKTFPSMKFILIGDNGQSDPEIYSRIAEEFSDRIIVIYIRTIRKRKTKKTQEITGQLKRKGIDMLSLKDSHEASIDAIKRGLISPYSEPSIRVERDAEQ